MASNREYDNDPDVYIGVKLPIKHDELGFFSKTKTTLEQAEYNLITQEARLRGMYPISLD